MWQREDDTLRRGEKTLSDWRRDKGFTLRQLAERCSTSVAYLSDIERGNRSGSGVMECLVRELEIPRVVADWHYYRHGMIAPDLRMEDRGHVERCLAEFRDQMLR